MPAEPPLTTNAPPREPEPWCPPDPLPDGYITQRLVLRYYTHDDAPALFEAVESSRDTLIPWLPWAVRENRSLPGTTFMIEQFRRWREAPNLEMGFVFGIFDRETGRLLGGTGLNRIQPRTHEAETGYWVRTDARRRGICTEATAAMLSWAFEPPEQGPGQGQAGRVGGWGLRRVVIVAAGSNTAYARIPTKLALRRERHSRLDRWIDGRGYDDTVGWGVLADEWDIERRAMRT